MNIVLRRTYFNCEDMIIYEHYRGCKDVVFIRDPEPYLSASESSLEKMELTNEKSRYWVDFGRREVRARPSRRMSSYPAGFNDPLSR